MRANSNPDGETTFRQASMLWEQGQLAGARKLFAVAAKQGHPSSQLNCGVFCEAGLGGPKDIYKALYWYRKASRAGSTAAFLNIADLYRKRGNRARMYFWLRRAVKTGEGSAKLEMARELLKGRQPGARKRAAELLEGASKSKSVSEEEREEAAALLSGLQA